VKTNDPGQRPLPDRLQALLGDVAAIQREQLRRANLLPQVQARLEQHRRAAQQPAAPPLWRRLVLPVGGLGLAAAAAAALLVLRVPRPLSVAVGDAHQAGRRGDVVTGRPERAVPVVFSDGSHLAVESGARLQVVDVDAAGATVAMERGAVEVEVIHRPSTHWVIQAGPYAVTVTGTRFLLGWEPDSETLSVDMHEGSVDVSERTSTSAPGVERSAGPRRATVRTGQSLRVSRRAGNHYQVTSNAEALALAPAGAGPALAPTPAAPEGEPAPPPAAVTVEPAQSGAVRALRAAPAVAPLPSDETWRRLAIEARYPEALRAALRVGFDSACRRLGGDDLVLLGDVARLAGDPTRAEKAYLAARSRFPALDRPVFALGLTAFEQRHDFARAGTWFEQYVRRYPGGALNREAAGRALESWARAGDNQRAQQAARDYLARYPAGPHAALARQTIGP
jgi:ferric-dicitrate binding protein FerR (iron transport regulator)